MSEAVATTGISLSRGNGTPAGVTITGNTAASPTVVTTGTAHLLVTGDLVLVANNTGSVPDINGWHRATSLTGTTFSIPVNVTAPGTGGTAQREAYTKLAELVSLTPPDLTRNKIPTTTHNDGRESSVLGIINQGDLAGVINLVGSNTTHQTLLSDFINNVRANWRIDFPSGLLLVGAGRVSRFGFVDAPVDAAQQANFGIAWATPISIFGVAAP